MKVSFDFDGTLDRDDVQEYARELIQKGHEVHICTSRINEGNLYMFNPRWNDDIFEVATELNIPKENIHFVNFVDKTLFFAENPGFLWHLDDCWYELGLINKHKHTEGIRVTSRDWKEECNNLLNLKDGDKE